MSFCGLGKLVSDEQMSRRDNVTESLHTIMLLGTLFIRYFVSLGSVIYSYKWKTHRVSRFDITNGVYVMQRKPARYNLYMKNRLWNTCVHVDMKSSKYK